MGQPLSETRADGGLNYRAIFEAVGEACLVLDSKLTVVAANSAYCQLTDQPSAQLSGRAFFDLLSGASPALISRLRESFGYVSETKSSHALWTDLYPRSNSSDLEFWKLLNIPVVNEEGEIAWLIHLVQKGRGIPEHDVSSGPSEGDKSLTRMAWRLMGPGELLHHSRYDMVGLATSTIAHELNQPLTAATNYMRASRRLMDAQPSPPGRAGELLDKALHEMKSVGAAIRALRGVVDKRDEVRELDDLNSLVDEAISACLVRSRDVGITIEAKLESQMPLVLMDRVHIGQVLLNLLRNALDAVKEGPGKRVSVVTEVVEGFVQVTVADTGPGLKDNIKERLFQPFVTTKEQGLGLGLSICKAIVDAHGGEIWGEDRDQGGAIFGFRLPAPKKRS